MLNHMEWVHLDNHCQIQHFVKCQKKTDPTARASLVIILLMGWSRGETDLQITQTTTYWCSWHTCYLSCICLYSWPLNNMGLNCVGPLIGGFFSIVNSVVRHNPWLVESMVGWIHGCRTADLEELCTWKNRRTVYTDCKLHADFQLWGGSVPLTPALFNGGSTVLFIINCWVCTFSSHYAWQQRPFSAFTSPYTPGVV